MPKMHRFRSSTKAEVNDAGKNKSQGVRVYHDVRIWGVSWLGAVKGMLAEIVSLDSLPRRL